ncbi:MAG TPA: hypothetical protein VMP01_14845 [Pirellulaceae bacterium]|nr:hypothetical protein [Pirellulaceae bacterium]
MTRIQFASESVKRHYDALGGYVSFLAAKELLGLEAGAVRSQVPVGQIGLHKISAGQDRQLVLGLDCRSAGKIRIIMVEVTRG